MDSDEKIEHLIAYVDKLEKRVSELQARLDRANDSSDSTMRKWLRCSVCGCRKIAHAVSVLDRADGDIRQKMALAKPSFWRSKTLGELEAYVCTDCGVVEWYVKQPDELKDVKDLLRILDGANEVDPCGPYR